MAKKKPDYSSDFSIFCSRRLTLLSRESILDKSPIIHKGLKKTATSHTAGMISCTISSKSLNIFAPSFGARSLLNEVCDQPLKKWATCPRYYFNYTLLLLCQILVGFVDIIFYSKTILFPLGTVPF